jgi:parallel beta-helix repeat protein
MPPAGLVGGQEGPGRALASWLPALLLALALLATCSPSPAGAAGALPALPIDVTGNDALDALLGGPGHNGTSWQTAYVIEGLALAGDRIGCGINISSTTRFLVVRNCTISGFATGEFDAGIELNHCRNVRIEDCTSSDSGCGVYVNSCKDITVARCRLDGNRVNGLRAEQTVSLTVTAGTTSANGIDGVRLWKVTNSTVSGNTLAGNHNAGLSGDDLDGTIIARNAIHQNPLGISILRAQNCTLEGNDVIAALDGIHLHDSSINTVSRNNVSGSSGDGVTLSTSSSNVISNNTVESCSVGIVLESTSYDNWVVDNTVRNNYFGGIEDKGTGNVVEGNRLSWNGWARWLLYGVGVLFVIAIALVTAVTLLRRRERARRRARAPVVNVEHLFPPGARGLWGVSRWVSNESIFLAQMQAAGPNRERLLARYEQSMSSARNAQWAQTIAASAMLAFVSVLPLSGVAKLRDITVTAGNVNDVLFATAVSVALFHVMVLVMLLVFGVMFLVSIMEGEAFKFVSTFPLSGGDVQRLKSYVFLRMYGLPMGVVLLVFPIGGFVLTGSVPFLLVSLGINAIGVAFVGYVLILIAHWLRSRVFSSDASRRATLLRVVVMSGYLIVAMFVYLMMQSLVGVIQDLYTSSRLAGGSGGAVNVALGLVPFPFAGAYVVAASLVPASLVPVRLLASALVGVLLLAAITYGLSRRGNRMLQLIAMEDAPKATSRATAAPARVEVATASPTVALMRKSLLMASRDMGGITYLILPVVLPLIMVVSMGSSGRVGPLDVLVSFSMYLGFIPFMLNTGLSSADEGLGGLLSSLPFRMRNLFRARQTIMVLMMSLISVIAMGVAWLYVTDPWTFAALVISIIPLYVVLIYVFLMLYSVLFGRVNRQYTFFAANIENKTLKYIGLIATMYVVIAVELGSLGVALGVFGAPLWLVLGTMVGLNLFLIAVLEAGARQMFPA